MKDNETLVAEMKRIFGKGIWVKNGKEFSGDSAVLWSGEGATMPDGLFAFDYDDISEISYIGGVHKALASWSEKNGIVWECYDPGTYLAYRENYNIENVKF